MRTVILLGELGKRYGTRHRLDISTPAEAIRALSANFKDFAAFVSSSHERNVGYRVLNMREDVDIDHLHDPASYQLAIVPVVAGSKNALTSILLGTALIAAAFLTGGASLAATGITFSSLAGQIVFGIGVSMALSGVAQLLAPVPTKPDAEETNSYVFNGAVNTTSQGQPVPIGYGRMIVGSAVISSGINVEDFRR
jgi:predicted phage tail protein